MTLATGRVTSHQVLLLSDTRQYEPRQERGGASVMTGTLKTTFLAGGVAVAFTGNVDLAQRAVRSVPDAGLGFRDTLRHFEEHTRDNQNEYLVAFAGPKRLFHIRAGSGQEKRQAWIGDHAGFESYQRGPQPARGPDFWRMTVCGPEVEDNKIVLDAIERFQAVLEDPGVPSVGDFFTVALGHGGTFRFVSVSTAFFDAEGTVRGPDGAAILASTGENRAYRFYKWFPRTPELAAAAYVFPEMEQCFVFYPNISGFADQCRLFSGLAGDALAAEIECEIGIRFEIFEFAHVGDQRLPRAPLAAA